MAKVPEALVENLSGRLMGRLKLKLFHLIAGQPNLMPSKKQSISYVEKTGKQFYPLGEMIADLFTNDHCTLISAADLEKSDNVNLILDKLDRYPLGKAVFVEVLGVFPDMPVGIWISSSRNDNGRNFYHLLIVEDGKFPEQLLNHINLQVSEQDRSAAFSYFAAGKIQTLSGTECIATDDPWVNLVFKVLNHVVTNHKESTISMDQLIENKWDQQLADDDFVVDDQECMDRIIQVRDGLIRATVGLADLKYVKPFSYEKCFDLRLHDLQAALQIAETIIKGGILVYAKDGYLITSDDYLYYMVLRLQKIKQIKVVVLGDPVPEYVKILSSGGFETLPPLLRLPGPVANSSGLEQNEIQLERFLDQLRIVNNTRSLVDVKCVVLTEDRHGDMLENLLLANGLDLDELKVMSYEGCTNVGALPIVMSTLQQIKTDLIFIIHRDADYMSADELAELNRKLGKLCVIPFITKGTDIESYYLSMNHVNHLYPNLSFPVIQTLLDEATVAARSISLDRLKKHRFGNKYEPTSLEANVLGSDYDANVPRYRLGKKTLGLFTGLLQKELGKNPELIKPSPFLQAEVLRMVANQLWPE
ncbi:hypothetical protein JN11_00829 [Mucilaginibacter frigoritolerans]|uniref:Uncharacterized protein n=1 Tax=Mucilaginibacter frigoritolerans TaxID=652788 RepID=A0A562UDQ7_9SPHI|nr:hypothetical protein [Mucilaginibacter frigoritolerans]TWJ03291.1 hypothetical protein JN11_00829 [Mucilaginibacter frigoritolerans]